MQYNREQFDKVLDELRQKYHPINPLTPYQWRFCEQIDIYPSSCKYFDLKTQTWGTYHSNSKLIDFLKAYFSGEVL